MTKRIEILIAKYLVDQISNNELQELIVWVESGKKNKQEFNKFITLNFTIEQLKSIDDDDDDDDALWRHIESKYKTPVRKLNYWKYVAAASVILVLGLTFFLQKNEVLTIQNTDPIIVNNNIEIGSDKAILTLEDGSDIVLAKGDPYVTENINSDGAKIVYSNSESTTKKEAVFNYLTIPRGGQFHVQLSDGTQVWLNSESKLKYPINFAKGQSREVELVYGEAYFDVTPSTEFNENDFVVHSNMQDVRVLGTEFNIKLYTSQENILTTLVEGKIAISNGIETKLLEPNQQSSLNIKNGTINIESVDIYDEISWKNGFLSFKNTSLQEIMNTLSRWYDVEIVFENSSLKDEFYGGVFNRNQNLEEILAIIQVLNAKEITFEIKDKKVIIK